MPPHAHRQGWGGESEPIAGFPYHWLGSAYPRWKGQWPEYVEPGNEDAVFAFKTVEHCDDTDPPQLCARFVETDEVIEITTDLDFDYIYGMAWSPDGNRVVFDGGYDGENPDLYLINADGSDLEQLTDDSENSDVIPAWWPTGEWIAFHIWPKTLTQVCRKSVFAISTNQRQRRLLGPQSLCESLKGKLPRNWGCFHTYLLVSL